MRPCAQKQSRARRPAKPSPSFYGVWKSRRAVDESFVESALHELEQIGDELEGIKRFYENASKDAERVERTSFPALAALKERGRNKDNDAGESGDINSDDYDGEE